ncbi:predicted protein [Chaetoceros tenuissimus]|uniref:Uncharacterized protein n=1 Tax=Chaetoceros tenuissimus TaxID=426638 RepID=A0AAD3CEV3_9STRA|nr:predicted protein [Chaetoceros tenuissimus]
MSLNQSDDEERGVEIVPNKLRQHSRLAQNEDESSMSTSSGITFRNRQEIDVIDYITAGCLILSAIFFFSGAGMSRIHTMSTYGTMYLLFSVCYIPHTAYHVALVKEHGKKRIFIKSLNFIAGTMYFLGACCALGNNLMGFSSLWIVAALLNFIEFTLELMEYIRMDDRPLLKLLEKSIGVLTSILIIAASSSKIDAYTGHIGNFTAKYELGTDLFLAAAVFHALYSVLAVLDMFTV